MSLGQVLVVGAFPLDEIRHRVEPQPVHPGVEPKMHDLEHFR
jgi:hypothetical protein